jgi:predicted enzyme related to lactoylglutathione lyase
MTRPIHFEIHAGEPERARRFYEGLFSWRFQQWGEVPYWLVLTGDGEPGIDGGMVPRQGPAPAPDGPVSGFPLTVGVDDLDAYLSRALDSGATVALPKHAVPGVGWLAYIRDTEGNLLGMMQSDEAAA